MTVSFNLTPDGSWGIETWLCVRWSNSFASLVLVRCISLKLPKLAHRVWVLFGNCIQAQGAKIRE